MAIIVSFINLKGGVGKTTLTVNFAWHYAYKKKWKLKVLVVDLDPQSNLSVYMLGAKKYNNIIRGNNLDIWDLFSQEENAQGASTLNNINLNNGIYEVVKYKKRGLIHIIPSRLKVNLPNKKIIFKLNNILSNVKKDYDLILLDCPPINSNLTRSSLLASNFVIIPVRPDYLSSVSLRLLINYMNKVKSKHKDAVFKKPYVVINQYSNYAPEETKSIRELNKIADENKLVLFNKNRIPNSRSFPSGARSGKPLFKTLKAHEKQKEKIDRLCEKFADNIGLKNSISV
jgi:chromosome partitioning protein